MKLYIAIFLTLLSLESFAQEKFLKETKYEYIQQSIGKGKPFFLEIGAKSCQSCQIMSETLSNILEENPSYGIYFINVKKERDVARKLKVMIIPTQIIYDKDGNEVYRNIGILREKEIEQLLIKYKF